MKNMPFDVLNLLNNANESPPKKTFGDRVDGSLDKLANWANRVNRVGDILGVQNKTSSSSSGLPNQPFIPRGAQTPAAQQQPSALSSDVVKFGALAAGTLVTGVVLIKLISK